MSWRDDEPLRARGRALTDDEKRVIIERVCAAWTLPGANQQRLGQLIFNAARFPDKIDIFNVEDVALAERIERLARGDV